LIDGHERSQRFGLSACRTGQHAHGFLHTTLTSGLRKAAGAWLLTPLR
jgi:hypothetical protein